MHPTTLTLHIHRNMAEDGATLIDLGGCLVRLYEDKWTALDRHGRFIFTDKEVAQLTRMTFQRRTGVSSQFCRFLCPATNGNIARRKMGKHFLRAERMYRVGKKRAGRLLDGREYSEIPEVSK